MSNLTTHAILGLVILAGVSAPAASNVSMNVDLEKATASTDWVLPPQGGAAFANGEIVLDGIAKLAPWVFLKEPTLSDLTLTCKIFVEPKGKGVRAFGVMFHSADSVSYHFVHVNRSSAILCWSNRDKHWNELARVRVKRPEGTWLDVKVECAGPAIRFYLAGKLVLSKSDAHWGAGRIGFDSSQGLIRVKDIHLEGTPARLDPPWRVVTRPKRHGTFHELPPKFRHTDVSGKLDITVTEPFVISSRITRPELGAHEQPHLFKMQDGSVLLIFHKDGDIHGAKRVVLKSTDKGKTWTPFPIPVNRAETVAVLRDGTVVIYDDYAFRKEGNTFVGQMCVSTNSGMTFGAIELAEFYRPANGASSKAGTYWKPKDLAKYRSTSAKWSDELCHALWRSALEKEDGTLIACAHTRYTGDKRARSVCYHSTDKGRTWGSESTISYDATMHRHEPVMSLCSNGDVLCIMRTGGGRPLMQARSTDGGRTWGKSRKTGSLGVDPDFCLMSNGVLACSYGRPGNRIMFSVDGTGKEWTDRLKIYEYRGGSFGYTGIVEVDPGRLLFVYDRRDTYPEYGGKGTTAIQGVYITVRRKTQ